MHYQIEQVVKNDFGLEKVRGLSVREQIMYVYKWIALYCRYNIHSAHNQTIYSVFVNRNSVCTGIARAAQYLFKLLGVESRLVFGKMNNSDHNSRHCWLLVRVERNWYHVDPSFAMPETERLLVQSGCVPLSGSDGLFYNFFCRSTIDIKRSRIIEEEELLPYCHHLIDYKHYQDLDVSPSMDNSLDGLGCILSRSGSTADIYLFHEKAEEGRA